MMTNLQQLVGMVSEVRDKLTVLEERMSVLEGKKTTHTPDIIDNISYRPKDENNKKIRLSLKHIEDFVMKQRPGISKKNFDRIYHSLQRCAYAFWDKYFLNVPKTKQGLSYMSVPAYTKTDLYELCNIEAATHQVDLTICDGDWVSEFIISESFNNRARPLRLASNVSKRLRRSPSCIEVGALAQTEGSTQDEIQLQAEALPRHPPRLKD
ncbi:unnamed protein product [Rhizopus stolonifer]